MTSQYLTAGFELHPTRAKGRSRPKARGQHMGLTPQQQREAWRRRAQGATLKELAKSYNVGKSTISRLAVQAMLFFSRKSKALRKEGWDQAKYEYEKAIQVCYKWKSVTLALCSSQKFLAFNFRYSFESERKPFVETDLKFGGVVHARGFPERNVLCEVDVLPESNSGDYIGGFHLTHMGMDDDKKRREEQPIQLGVTLRDPTSMLKASLIDGLRDAALSGFRFMHIELECQEPTDQELEKALSDMRERGFTAARLVHSVKMWPKIELEHAPEWARRAD
jgi:hypothetical protein